MTIVITALLMVGMGTGLAVVLAAANRRLYVYEDPRIDDVEDMLPSNNCGACGTPSCRIFAELAVLRKIAPGKCTVNTPDANAAIADYLGVDAGTEEKRVARLACAGGSHVARNRAYYSGLETCRAAAMVEGGPKSCTWGCLGFGDCMTVCDFDAITMDEHGLPVVNEDLCTACNACVEVCPKSLFSLQPLSHRLWIACKNEAEGGVAEADCEVACTACGRCAADAPGLITMQNNLAQIDYTQNHLATRTPIQRCPTGAIVYWNSDGTAEKGVAAKKIIRTSPLPCHASRITSHGS
ncbi:MAG: RnfABCDGE type electron transport complex subunit B [Lentisphaeria bacterium]|nr:RnfABCDGE type electron transport complex subunit B [Lentisphaeria bacterium]